MFILIDFALYGVRKFLTHTERFDPTKNREDYFETLELIRGHLLRTFDEVAKIAELPNDYGFRYHMVSDWDKNIYELKE